MKCIETPIPGCYELLLKEIIDVRGKFVKTFHKQMFSENKLETNFAEEYYSISKKGVLRGLHLQLPPYASTKLVYCIEGAIFDVLVDLRRESPYYGKPVSFDLADNKATALYIPTGVAHAFYVLSDQATVISKASTLYAPEYDAGILWKSITVWPTDNPLLSEKDKHLPLLDNFVSPFTYVLHSHKEKNEYTM